MKILVTCKPGKEKKAIEEILGMLFQLDPNSKLEEFKIKPGLFMVSSDITKEELVKLAFKFKRSYVKKLIPIDIVVNDPREAIILLENLDKNKRIAVRCNRRFGVSATTVERELGYIIKQKGFSIDLVNPDYVILIEPIKNYFVISFVSLMHFQILTGKKSI